jgi:hypothetical protein
MTARADPRTVRPVLAPLPSTDGNGPPVAEWERDGVLTELARLALSLRLDGASAVPHLGRLTAWQREEITLACGGRSARQRHDV